MPNNFVIDMVMFAYNRAEYTDMTLKSLIEIDSGFDFDKVNFVVINHSSTDNTTDVIKDFMNKNKGIINKFCTESNRGVSNGLEHFRNHYCTSAKYIGKIDNDSIFTKNWLKYLYDAINTENNLGIVGAAANYDQHVGFINKGKYFKSSFVGGRFLAKKEIFKINKKLRGSGIWGWGKFQEYILQKWDIGWCNPPAVIEHVGDNKFKHEKSIKSVEYINYMKEIERLK